MNPFLLLCGSPRKSGNSDMAMAILAQSLAPLAQKEQFPPVQTLFVRDHRLLYCTGCNVCGHAQSILAQPHSPSARCPQYQKDQSLALLAPLEQAGGLCIISPIQNYHLPAGLKALLDRLQPWYTGKKGVERTRPFFAVLIAGRPRGEKLFAGSLLTLRWALAPLGYTLEPPLVLRGLDAPGDLAGDTASREALTAYAAAMAARLSGGNP